MLTTIGVNQHFIHLWYNVWVNRFAALTLQLFIFLAALAVPVFVFASSSTNFVGTQEHGGPMDFQATSPSYNFKAEVGHPGVGISTSTNYTYWHGTFWDEEAPGVNATIRWAMPEMRVAPTTTNSDVLFFLSVRNPITHATVFSLPNNLYTSIDGTYSAPLPLTVSAGTYDIGIKTHQHLTKVLRGINLAEGPPAVLNFTQPDNSSPYGAVVLLAGDINGATTTPALMGDDVVNSVDLSIIINDLDKDDVTHRAIRSNLNQDPVVNSVDLSLMLKNLDLEGEE